MLSPNPLSLFCAIILCFPLALVFTISSTCLTVTNSRVTLASPPPPNKPLPKTPPTNSTTNTTTNKKPLPPPPPPPRPPRRPPPSYDDYDDLSLFKRASQVNPDPTPRDAPKKVAFMFLTTTSLPFAPLWEVFFNQTQAQGRYNVYIHVDPKLEYNPPFRGVFSGRVIPSSKPTARNTPTLIAAARRLLAHALLDDSTNYMFTLLSASCVPLHSFNFTYNTLAGSSSSPDLLYHSMCHLVSGGEDSGTRDGTQSGTGDLVWSSRSFIEVLSNETTAYGRWVARGEDVMLPEVGLDKFRVGSQFWSLTRRHSRVVVDDVRLWSKFKLPCVTPNTCFPEENYFPTLLSMVDPYGLVPATLTNVNWRGQRGGHPRTYNGSEVGPGLIRWLRERRPRYGDLRVNGSDLFDSKRWDPFLFARKFAPNCVKPLLSIANDVLFKD